MNDKLKPVRCGCGGEARVLHQVERGYYVRCRDCFTRTDFKVTEAEAIEAWNRAMGERTANVVNIAHVRGYPPEGECSNCGFDVIDDGEYCPGCGYRLEWE